MKQILIAVPVVLLLLGCDNQSSQRVAKGQKDNEKSQENVQELKDSNVKHRVKIAQLEIEVNRLHELSNKYAARVDELNQLNQNLQRQAKEWEARLNLAEATVVHPVANSQARTGYSLPIQNPKTILVENWTPLAPSAVKKIIRDRAEQKWPGDFSMINHVIDRETESYEKLLKFYKTSNPAIKEEINKAAMKWPNDFGMMVHTIERQIEEKARFEAR